MSEELTEGLIIERGGWHPRYARVLLVEQLDEHAIAIVDGNGDGAELELETWFRDGRGWHAGSSSGFGALDSAGQSSSGWSPGIGYAIGHAPVDEIVRVEWRGRVVEATTNQHGLWCCLLSDNGRPPEDHRLTPAAPSGAPYGSEVVVGPRQFFPHDLPRRVDQGWRDDAV